MAPVVLFSPTDLLARSNSVHYSLGGQGSWVAGLTGSQRTSLGFSEARGGDGGLFREHHSSAQSRRSRQQGTFVPSYVVDQMWLMSVCQQTVLIS